MKKAFAFTVFLCLIVALAIGQSSRSLVELNPQSFYTKSGPWPNISRDSISWFLRTTYEVYPNTKNTKAAAKTDTTLINVLCDDIIKGRVMAFGTDTDSFTTVLTYDQVIAISKQMIADPNYIYRYRIMEGILGRKYNNLPYHTILAIAPEKQNNAGIWTPMFWIYFPHIRTELVSRDMDNANIINWETIFDNRKFSARFLFATDTMHCN